MHHQTRILGIAGSLRKASWNRRLLEAASKLTPPELTLEVYAHLQDVPMFNEDIEADPGPGVLALRSAVESADGLLLATPEYNHALPAVMKNAIDWLSRGGLNRLHNKPVAILGATVGAWGTRLAQAALRQTLAATGAKILVEPMLFVARASSCFDERGELHDAQLAESLTRLLRSYQVFVSGT